MSDLDYPGYIVVRDSNGRVLERRPNNKFWWEIASLRAIETKDILEPVEVLIKE